MRSEKKLLKQEIEDKLAHFGSFVIMQYKSLTANAANEFRREINKLGGDVEVMRKRVFFKAATDSGLELNSLTLDGHIGLVFLGEDSIETVKTVFKFSKDSEKAIEVLGGRLDGQLYSSTQVERLSTLPGKNEMRAELLSLLVAPLSQTLGTIDALLTTIPHLLQNKGEQASDESTKSE